MALNDDSNSTSTNKYSLQPGVSSVDRCGLTVPEYDEINRYYENLVLRDNKFKSLLKPYLVYAISYDEDNNYNEYNFPVDLVDIILVYLPVPSLPPPLLHQLAAKKFISAELAAIEEAETKLEASLGNKQNQAELQLNIKIMQRNRLKQRVEALKRLNNYNEDDSGGNSEARKNENCDDGGHANISHDFDALEYEDADLMAAIAASLKESNIS
jgi:hypothetical protein